MCRAVYYEVNRKGKENNIMLTKNLQSMENYQVYEKSYSLTAVGGEFESKSEAVQFAKLYAKSIGYTKEVIVMCVAERIPEVER